ncbi:MAG: hypothetical protein VX367_10610 [SAR324 cluster bacterium]|nr:hypothetical protein [SAR324 cluster bacterium]
MRKPLGIQKCNGPTDRHTDTPTDTARCRVACPRLRIGGGQKMMSFFRITFRGRGGYR